MNSVDVAGTGVQLSDSLKLLGVTFDVRLSFDDQIGKERQRRRGLGW